MPEPTGINGDAENPTPSSSPTGVSAGLRPLLPWVGIALVAGLAGGGLGISGAFGRPNDTVTVVGSTSILNHAVLASSCPGGPVVTSLPAGLRVLAVQRDDSTKTIGIRDPRNVASVLWLNPGDVIVDSDQSPASTLPVGQACPSVTVTVETPPPAPAPSPTPTSKAPTPLPSAPADTTAPTIGTPTASVNPVLDGTASVISVTATDDVGVSGVTITWAGGGYTGGTNMTLTGGIWTYSFTPTNTTDGNVTFTVQAADAAGNLSPKKTLTLHFYYLG